MDDLISRQAVLEATSTTLKITGKENAETVYGYIKKLCDDIKALPSAQQWIPCSKRLPPELKPVNVTWINRKPSVYYEALKDKPFTDTAVIFEGKWYWQSAICVELLKEYGESPADNVADAIEIVAWQPLPEPYKGENAND